MSASKTISASLAKLYKACSETKLRARWLNEKGMVIRKVTPEKSMRITWSDGKTNVELRFSAKGDAKSQIVADLTKLPNAKAVVKMKSYWAEALGRLQKLVEV
jgi:uncharacterized protein YndB with AHSA1/START domain